MLVYTLYTKGTAKMMLKSSMLLKFNGLIVDAGNIGSSPNLTKNL